MSEIIDNELAKSLIKEYRQQNASPGGPGIKTHEGHHLNGFFLERETLETILNNPAVSGVSVHLAKHPDFKGKPGNHLTLVYGGAAPNPDAVPATPLVSSGAYYCGPPPCPPKCADS
jgi:hypothetical protein